MLWTTAHLEGKARAICRRSAESKTKSRRNTISFFCACSGALRFSKALRTKLSPAEFTHGLLGCNVGRRSLIIKKYGEARKHASRRAVVDELADLIREPD